MLVALVAIRGLGLLDVSSGCGFLAVATTVADEPISKAVPSRSQQTDPQFDRVFASQSPLVQATNESQAKPGGLIDARVELLWASEIPRRWAGTITWDNPAELAVTPHIHSPVLLASGPILSGGVTEIDHGGLVFGPPARLRMVPAGEGILTSVETRSGGISFRVQGRLGDRATLGIDGEDVAPGLSVTFSIGDLIMGNAIDAMINDHASVTIRRVATGDLKVRLGDSNTIFWSDQKVDVSLVNPMAVPIGKSTSSLVLDCLTYSAADDSLISSETFPVTTASDGLHCPQGQWVSPSENGAYRVRFRLRDNSGDRRWLSTALSPTTMATSISRSISTALPQSLTTPLGIPLGPFTALSGNGASSQPQVARDFGSIIPPSLGDLPISGLSWYSPHEPTAIAETTLSVAVFAGPRELPLSGQSASQEKSSSGWTQVGVATVRSGPATVSRLFMQPTTQWFGGAPSGSSASTSMVHVGQRLDRLDPGQQLALSVPVSKVGVRHRAVIRVPSETSLRLVAELVDIDPSTGVPQPLGVGLAIIRSGQRISAMATSQTANQLASTQALGVDASGVSEDELWHEAMIDFWPRSPTTQLVLTNRSPISPAGIGRVDVMVEESAASQHRPAKQNRRSIGDARMAAMRLEITDLFEQFSDRGIPTASRPLDYQQVWTATNRVIETLHREGYGGLILTVSSDGTSLFPDHCIVADAAWNANWSSVGGPVDPLRLMLRMFERESLQFIPCIRPSGPVLALEEKIRTDASAMSVATRSPLAGQLGAWIFDGPPLTSFPIYNGANEAVFTQFASLLLELNERCRDRACVPAIGVLVDERSYLRTSPLVPIDDQTLDAFHASLGESAPPRESLDGWIRKSGAVAFQRWQAARLASGFQQILNQIDGRNVLILSCDSALPSHFVELGRDRRIITTRLQRRALTEPLANRVRDEACNASVPVSMAGGSPPLAYLAAVFHQPVSDAAGFEPGPYGNGGSVGASDFDLDAVPFVDGVNTPSQSGVTTLLDPTESSLAFAHLVNRSDRRLVAIGGGAVNQPASDVRRRSLRSFAELPPVMMNDVEPTKPLGTSLRVRMATYHDETYIYAVNQTRWPVVWEAILSRSATVHRLGPTPPQRSVAIGLRLNDDPLRAADQSQLSTGDSDLVRWPNESRPRESGTRWQTIVDPGELVAIRFSSREAALVNWRATFAGSASQIATIRAGVENAVSAIAEKQHLRRRGLIANASFEADGGGIPGWMVAQYPANCVAVDPNIAVHGGRSIRLTGQSDRVGGSWIVSQAIVPPRSGRLAVSVRFRGGQAKKKKDKETPPEPLVVRMSLEGTVGGTPIRKSKSVTLESDGNWGEPQWLEIARLPSLPVESLRLTIDLMSSGEVWVDDIVCYDQFMTAAEKTHWEHVVFLAAGGLPRGDCVAASRLFDSHWALDLVDPSPTDKGQSASVSSVRRAVFNPSVTGAKAELSSDSSAATQQMPPLKTDPPRPRPGWSDRLKSWLPRPLRFGS